MLDYKELFNPPLKQVLKKKPKPSQHSFYHYKQQKYQPFEVVIQVDVKYLTDIKEFKQERLK